MFYTTTWFYTILLTFIFPLFAAADENTPISRNLNFSSGLSFSQALQIEATKFEVKNAPTQGGDNQPISTMACFPKYLSLYGTLNAKNIAYLHMKVNYNWNQSFNLGIYQKAQKTNKIQLKDLYVDTKLEKYQLDVWAGVRSFEFSPVTLFSMANPFDQISLQGGGIGTENLQLSFSFQQDTVNTVATRTIDSHDKNGNPVSAEELVVNSNGMPKPYEITEYITSIFLSAKLLLAEGRLFEPIFAFRYYSGGHNQNLQARDINIYRAKPSSAFIAGGIFSRPISNGISGSTTVWFSSLPSDVPVSSTAIPINRTYGGAGRVAPNTPMNTIGIIDSSEFYFLRESALFSAIYLTNNTYSSNLPVLKISGDKKTLEPSENNKSNSNNKISLAFEPAFFISRNLVSGADLNLSYTSKKLFDEDVNSIIVSPFLKWTFDEKLNSEKYFFTSLSYGLYDWKIKKLSNGTQTNNLITLQAGGIISL